MLSKEEFFRIYNRYGVRCTKYNMNDEYHECYVKDRGNYYAILDSFRGSNDIRDFRESLRTAEKLKMIKEVLDAIV